MEMDIKNLNSVIAKRVIDPNDLKMGMFVSRIDYEGKKIENRYYISSIKTKIAPFTKRKIVIRVRCYDIIADEFVNFAGEALLNFIQPSGTDFYDYQFTPIDENNNLKEDDYVVFMEPKKIQMTIKRGRPKHVFLIIKLYKDKYGVFVNLIDGNGDYLINVPVEFLVPIEFVGYLPVMNNESYSYDRLEAFKDKVEDLKNKLYKTLDLPKEFEENKKVNFGFSFSANDAGIKIDFYNEHHNSMSQTFIDFSKNNSGSTKQMIEKYVSALSMLTLSFNKINGDDKTIS